MSLTAERIQQIKDDAEASALHMLELIAQGVPANAAQFMAQSYIASVMQDRTMRERMDRMPKEDWER